MRFIRQSLIWKLFIHLFWFALLLATIVFYFYYRKQEFVPYNLLVAALSSFLIFFLVTYYIDVVRPLKIVLREVQSLLAGKTYKRLYTNRMDEIGVIAFFFNQVTKSLGQVSSNLKDRERILDELSIASQLQRDILPLEMASVRGLQIAAKNKPATEVGGDSFNIFTSHHKTYLYIGDVTGHGVAAGLIMTMVNSLVTVFADINRSAYEIIVNVNRYIKTHVRKAMFMTMVMLSWDHDLEKMTYVGAGHEYILIYRATTGVCEAVLSGGVALGMVPDVTNIAKEIEIELQDGDFVVLYSDGIAEARNDSGELYGLERLKKAIQEFAPEYSADGLNYHIALDVTRFMGNHKQDDDMTLIVIKRDSDYVPDKDEKQTTSWQAETENS